MILKDFAEKRAQKEEAVQSRGAVRHVFLASVKKGVGIYAYTKDKYVVYIGRR